MGGARQDRSELRTKGEIGEMNRTGTLDRVEALVSPYGVVSFVGQLLPARGLAAFSPWLAPAGYGVTQYDRLFASRGGHRRTGARADAGDRDSCPATELADDRCPLSPADPDATIRWVQGTDLVTGELTWLSAVMACYQLQNPRAGECFWYRISTRCEAHTDPMEALVRALCEVIERGSARMGRPQMAPAFGFLLDGLHRSAAPPRPPLPGEPAEALTDIIKTLADRGMRAVAVDRTCTELAGVGLTAVCVVLPELHPMSLHPLGQYRAHPRLYELPPLMGHRSVAEEELNPWPLPFA
jgi:hypothetical protein